MAPSVYRYELRRGDELVATGRLTQERAIEVGERPVIGGLLGIVREIQPVLGGLELRLVVQLCREGVDIHLARARGPIT